MEKLIETHTVKPEVSFLNGKEEEMLRVISIEDETFLDNKMQEIEDFIANNHGLGKTEQEKDALYHDAQTLWREFVSRLKSMKYFFYLNRKQYNYLTDLLIEKMEYDVDTVFIAVELTNMLGEWHNNKGKTSDTEVKEYIADATEITYMYHLIAKNKVKGLTTKTFLFVEILKRIGFISKVVSYYDTFAKNSNKEIQDWVSTFEEGVYIEGKDWGRNVKLPVEKTEPKKASKKEK